VDSIAHGDDDGFVDDHGFVHVRDGDNGFDDDDGTAAGSAALPLTDQHCG
jgi:hypothetical protein